MKATFENQKQKIFNAPKVSHCVLSSYWTCTNP